jgi:hypothetical protein
VERRTRLAILRFVSHSSIRRSRGRSGVLGLGLDGDDGHKRITEGESFILVGGSRETHERMQDVVVRMCERLERRGKTFGELSRDEFEDLARESL